ncbi:MAG TPA: hypothetical protein VFA45_24620 [Actinomycetes bacterium]|nr:hypothetical protein [Actinomycetes bacterium]
MPVGEVPTIELLPVLEAKWDGRTWHTERAQQLGEDLGRVQPLRLCATQVDIQLAVRKVGSQHVAGVHGKSSLAHPGRSRDRDDRDRRGLEALFTAEQSDDSGHRRVAAGEIPDVGRQVEQWCRRGGSDQWGGGRLAMLAARLSLQQGEQARDGGGEQGPGELCPARRLTLRQVEAGRDRRERSNRCQQGERDRANAAPPSSETPLRRLGHAGVPAIRWQALLRRLSLDNRPKKHKSALVSLAVAEVGRP